MRYRYILKHERNKKYILDEDSVDYDTTLSIKAIIYEEIDADLVNEMNRLNNIIENQNTEINKLKQQNSILRRDAKISRFFSDIKDHANQNI